MASPLPTGTAAPVRRALVTKLRHHGDVLLASPVFTALRAPRRDSEIDALVYSRPRRCSTAIPRSRSAHDRPRMESAGLVTQARASGTACARCARASYDLLVHLTEHPRGLTLARLLRPRYAVTREREKRATSWRRTSRISIACPRDRAPRGRAEPRCAAPHRRVPDEADRRSCWSRRRGREQGDAAPRKYGLAPREFVQVHPGSRLALQVLAGESAPPRCSISWRRRLAGGVITGARRPRAAR
jgi:heptosyltransferase-3